MDQTQRDKVMTRFRKSGLEFLVATDVAARGIDVDDVEVVFNYDLPYDGEDYVHRIGRTGRKGRSGLAISFASGREVFLIRNIQRYTNKQIQRGRPPTVSDVTEARANATLDKLRATLKSGEYKRSDHLIERLLEEGFASTDIASALLHHLQGPSSIAAQVKPVAAQAPTPVKFQRPSVPPVKRNISPVHAAPKVPEKMSRAVPNGKTRIRISIGKEMNVVPIDIVDAITAATGLPGKIIGTIDIRERHLFADVSDQHAEEIIAKMNKAEIKGHKIKVKEA
jgi:ATP-dependent RNA helicase DeaD